MSRKHIKYKEGQWFSIPLRNKGFAIGIIVRGNYESKGGLGYFFGPIKVDIPIGRDTYLLTKDNPILIRRFGDLGIITGEWPLIDNGKEFIRDDWPVPLFYRRSPLFKDKIVLVEYSQNFSGMDLPINENVVNFNDDVLNLPKDGLSGSGAIELLLTQLLSD